MPLCQKYLHNTTASILCQYTQYSRPSHIQIDNSNIQICVNRWKMWNKGYKRFRYERNMQLHKIDTCCFVVESSNDLWSSFLLCGELRLCRCNLRSFKSFKSSSSLPGDYRGKLCMIQHINWALCREECHCMSFWIPDAWRTVTWILVLRNVTWPWPDLLSVNLSEWLFFSELCWGVKR